MSRRLLLRVLCYVFICTVIASPLYAENKSVKIEYNNRKFNINQGENFINIDEPLPDILSKYKYEMRTQGEDVNYGKKYAVVFSWYVLEQYPILMEAASKNESSLGGITFILNTDVDVQLKINSLLLNSGTKLKDMEKYLKKEKIRYSKYKSGMVTLDSSEYSCWNQLIFSKGKLISVDINTRRL